MTEWEPLRLRLREALPKLRIADEFTNAGSLTLHTPSQERVARAKKHWWQREIIEHTPLFHRARFARLDEHEYFADLLGTTLIGGPHDVSEAVHDEVKSHGWVEPGEPGFGGRVGGRFALHIAHLSSFDELIDPVIAGLTLLGARPDQDWTLEVLTA